MDGRGKQNGGIFLELLADNNSTAAHLIVCNMKAEPFFFLQKLRVGEKVWQVRQLVGK
jgi:hypothetical protein